MSFFFSNPVSDITDMVKSLSINPTESINDILNRKQERIPEPVINAPNAEQLTNILPKTSLINSISDYFNKDTINKQSEQLEQSEQFKEFLKRTYPEDLPPKEELQEEINDFYKTTYGKVPPPNKMNKELDNIYNDYIN